jgi:hypothetical protein
MIVSISSERDAGEKPVFPFSHLVLAKSKA